MADFHVVSGLKAKQEEIRKRISDLKREIKVSQDELAAVSKTLRLFGENYRTGGDRLFRRGDLPRIVFDALRENPEGLNVDQLAAIAMQDEGIDASDPELTATVRQRCMMAMYRYLDKGVIVKERRGSVRVWRLVT